MKSSNSQHDELYGIHFECIICGKGFRGGSDLRRHQWGVSINHLSSCDGHESFPYQCNGCGIYFKSREHLAQHRECKFQLCSYKVRPVPSAIKNLYHHANGQPDTRPSTTESAISIEVEEEPFSPLSTRSRKRQESSPSRTISKKPKLTIETSWKDSPEKKPNHAMECMVCGKVFARGLADLDRHKTAITLNHYYLSEKSSIYRYSCHRCGLCFAQSEFLDMHQIHTSCNPNYQPPPVLSTPTTKSNPTSPRVTMSTNTRSSYNKDVPSEEKRTPRGQPLSSEPLPHTIVVNKVITSNNNRSNQQPTPVLIDSWQTVNARPKRTRVLVPQDRKAFFSVASLLIDPSLVPPGLQLNAENYEEYILVDKRGPVEKLKQLLLYDC